MSITPVRHQAAPSRELDKQDRGCFGNPITACTVGIFAAAIAPWVYSSLRGRAAEFDPDDSVNLFQQSILLIIGYLTVATVVMCMQGKKSAEPEQIDPSHNNDDPPVTPLPQFRKSKSYHQLPGIAHYGEFTRYLDNTKKNKGKTNTDRAMRYLVKALLEHRMAEDKVNGFKKISSFVTLEELLDAQHSTTSGPIKLEFKFKTEQGPRLANEDEHLIMELDNAYLVGIFDGHGGKRISKLAKELVANKFESKLEECGGDLYDTFIQLFAEMDKELCSNRIHWTQGSTVVLCHIAKDTGLTWTATLGDSEAFAIGNFSGEAKIVPLSYLRNWSHPTETTRAVIGIEKYFEAQVEQKRASGKELNTLEKEYINCKKPEEVRQLFNRLKSEWINTDDPKALRYPGDDQGVNMSRSLGDLLIKSLAKDHPTVSNVPFVTVFPLNHLYQIVIGCDGLTDFRSANMILDTFEKTGEDEDLALELTKSALANMGQLYGDNVTVITAKIKQDKN